jgi:hypothetical protein
MTKFINGPADGVTLMLRRASLLLRVVYSDTKDEFDALDWITDSPQWHEGVYVYRRIGEPMVMMIDYCDRRGRHGQRVASAEYEFLPAQPAEQYLRRPDAWQSWCRRAAARLAQQQGGSNAQGRSSIT